MPPDENADIFVDSLSKIPGMIAFGAANSDGEEIWRTEEERAAGRQWLADRTAEKQQIEQSRVLAASSDSCDGQSKLRWTGAGNWGKRYPEDSQDKATARTMAVD